MPSKIVRLRLIKPNCKMAAHSIVEAVKILDVFVTAEVGAKLGDR